MASEDNVADAPIFPVAVMVASLVGLCFPPILLVTGALGLYAFRKAKTDPRWAPRKQIAAMSMAISGAGIAIFLGLFLPNFKRVQVRLKQRQCHDQLERLGQEQRKFYERQKRYGSLEEIDPLISSLPVKIGVSSDDPAVPELIKSTLGVRGDCPACSVTMICSANLDGDPTIDVWTVSTLERVGNGGVKIPGFVPWNEIDDVDN